MNSLRTTWNDLALRYTDNAEFVDKLWVEIEKKYTAKNRYYHNLIHLGYMVEKAFDYKHRLIDLDTVLFSVFYHDIIYNIQRQDNEQKSADTAKERLTALGVSGKKIANCQKQILATKNHKHSDDNDTNYFVDFDLAILGESPETYHDYSNKIRKEYSLYPDFLYKKGRRKVLQYFLEMDRIFKTDEFNARYGQRAKENLMAEFST